MSEFRLGSGSPAGTPGTVRRAKRGAVDGVVMTSTTPKTIVAEAKFEGLTLEGVNQNLIDIKADEGEVEAVSREEEIIKKRKTELTTTRQIETRIKRQLLLEDGKVIEDSGPIVSTNTTEDTDRQETVQTEHRTLGDPTEEDVTKNALDSAGNPIALEDGGGTQKLVSDGGGGGGGGVAAGEGKPKTISAIVARPDGLLRNTKEEVEVSREETKECTVMAERKHFGDFTDDAYLRAINSGVDDIRELLLTEEARLELAPSGPQLVSHSTKSRKVIDSEDTDIQLSAKPDGTLVTEKTQTRQHEVLFDDDLPGDERLSTGIDQVDTAERIIDQKGSSARYFKQRDEQHVDLIDANGQVVGHEMRYSAENTQMEKDGNRPENLLSEWDSLSDRLRKARRLGRHSTPKEAIGAVTGLPPLVDRTDALTKRPLDFDREDETRKHETSKWLESHFGSESRSSRGSRDDLDDIVEPTKKTYFNVTIKSNEEDYKGHGLSAPAKVVLPEREEQVVGRKYFQGVSEWNDRNRYASRGSRENLVDEEYGYRSGKQKDSSYKEDSAYVSSSTYFTTPRSPKHLKDSNFNARYGREARSVSPDRIDYVVQEERPTVPQRKKALERKLTNGSGMMMQKQHVVSVAPTQVIEYAPRSRSISPIQIPPAATTLRKPYQKTRFSSIQDLSHSSRTTNANSRAQSTPPKSKVGSAIGNSIRKLVGKIRSASAERKLRLKSAVKQHRRSPSPSSSAHKRNSSSSATYQQYNVIDGHIGRGYSPPPAQPASTAAVQNQSQRAQPVSHKQNGNTSRRAEREHRVVDREPSYDRRGSSDIVSDMTTNSAGIPIPKQKYYLGENPYGGSIFGKENKYDGAAGRGGGQRSTEERIVTSSHTRSYSQPPPPTGSTLGRFSKSTNRLTSNGHGHDHNGSSSSYVQQQHYQTSSQTLPRKLYEQKAKSKPLHSSTINVSIVNNVAPSPQPPPLTNTGPVKPARTYKALNRSKSFNVHGLNGTNDPSPIYLEKLSRNNYNSFYRSNSHLDDLQRTPSRHQNESMQLKSPSIVNLISRSTRDLTQSPLYEDERVHEYSTNKKTVFLKNLQNRAPELYRTLHGGPTAGEHAGSPSREYLNTYINREQESSLGSRSPLTINKDTASIVRRGSSSTEDYSESYKITQKNEDPARPGVTNTVRNFSKKTIPTKDGRGLQTIETSEVRTTSSSRYRADQPPPSAGLKYQEFRNGSGLGSTGTGGVVIELRGNS
uniref:Chascon n=1 Tax=Culex tarsalis TaxID=7177 RepID=A0A1Q3FP46_CULTA